MGNLQSKPVLEVTLGTPSLIYADGIATLLLLLLLQMPSNRNMNRYNCLYVTLSLGEGKDFNCHAETTGKTKLLAVSSW